MDYYRESRMSHIFYIFSINLGDFMTYEALFQKNLIKQIKRLFPTCIVLKNDANYLQGFPDLLVLYKDKWAALECKRTEHASRQPNQEYYISLLKDMSYASFVYPENREKVLDELQSTFKS